MSRGFTDILIITYNRPEYTRLSLARLLETCDEFSRVWIWQNGSDPETMKVVSTLRDHPRVFRYHHSEENRKLRDATNWLLSESCGELVGKVDDDCLVPAGWLQSLRAAHHEEPALGACACWHFTAEDFAADLAQHKLRRISPDRQIVTHPWVGGSGFLLKRECVAEAGVIGESESLTDYLIRIARRGWIHGWHYPLLIQDHMDDPRSPNTLLTSDEDLGRFMPLSAANFGARTLADWDAQLRRSARTLLMSPSDPGYYAPWRMALQRGIHRLRLRSLFRRKVAAP